MSEVDVELQPGGVVAGVALGYVQTRTCKACGEADTDVMLIEDVGVDEPAWASMPCEACGATDVNVQV